MNTFTGLKKSNKDIITGYLLAILLLLIFQPYFVWNTLLPSLASYCLALYFLIHSHADKQVFPYAILLFFVYLYISLVGGFTIFGAISNLNIILVLLCEKKRIYYLFDCFRKLYSVIISFSMLIFIIVVVFQVPLPYTILEPLNPSKTDSYYEVYPLFVSYVSCGITLPRFCGIFDEPGVVGTISVALLMTQGYNLRDKFNIPILFSGILSASLFFVIITFAYILFFTNTKDKILLIFLTLVVFYLLADNETFHTLFSERLSFQDGKLAGDSRSSHLSKSWFDSFRGTSGYWFGLGNFAHENYNPGGCSYLDIIIDYGTITLLLYILIYICFLLSEIKSKQNLFQILLVFCGIIYQRPFITNLGYAILYFAPIIVLHIKEYNEKVTVFYRKDFLHKHSS